MQVTLYKYLCYIYGSRNVRETTAQDGATGYYVRDSEQMPWTHRAYTNTPAELTHKI